MKTLHQYRYTYHPDVLFLDTQIQYVIVDSFPTPNVLYYKGEYWHKVEDHMALFSWVVAWRDNNERFEEIPVEKDDLLIDII